MLTDKENSLIHSFYCHFPKFEPYRANDTGCFLKRDTATV